MPNLSEIATSRDFRQSDREVQRQMLSDAEPKGFGALRRSEQDQLLARVDDELGRDWWEGEFDDSFMRGLYGGFAGFTRAATNLIDLNSPDEIQKALGNDPQGELEKRLRDKTAELEGKAEGPRDKTYFEIGAEQLGGAAAGIIGYGSAIGAAGLALTSAGVAAPYATAAVLVGGSVGALSAAEQGWLESLKAGTLGAAFFALFPGLKTAGAGPILSGATIGTTAFMMTPEEMEIEERLGHGGMMTVLGMGAGLGNRIAARRQAGRRTTSRVQQSEAQPEVQAKLLGEKLMEEKMQERGYKIMEREQLAEDRLNLPKDEKVANIDERIEKLPLEERAEMEDFRSAERAAEKRRPDLDIDVKQLEDRIRFHKLELTKPQGKASRKFINDEIAALEAKLVEKTPEPLGLHRDPVVDMALRNLSDKDFASKRKASIKEVDRLEREYDADPARVEQDFDFRRKLAEAQDRYESMEIENFRRRVSVESPEEIAITLRELGTSKTDQVKTLVLLDEVRARGIQSEIDPHLQKFAARSPDHAEILKGKLSGIRDLARESKEDVPPPRVETEGKGDPAVESARGRATEPEAQRQLPPGEEAGKGFQGEFETFRGQFEERFGKMGEYREEQLPPGERPPPPGERALPEGREVAIRESTNWDRRRLEYYDDGQGARWIMRELGLEDMPDNVWHKFSNLRGIPDGQDGMVRWGAPTLIPDPRIPGRQITRFMSTTAYDVVTHEPGVYEAIPSTTRTHSGMADVLVSVMGKGRKYEADSWNYFLARQKNELINQTIDPRTGVIRQSTLAEILTLKSREKNWDLDTIKENLKLADPTRVATYEAMKAYQRKMADFYVDTGFITRSQVNAWQRKEFAFNFMRLQEVGRRGNWRKVDPLAKQYGIYKLFGSKRDVRDPYTNFITGPQDLFRAALQNRWALDTIDVMNEAGGFLERLRPTAQRITVGRENLKQALIDDITTNEGLTEAEAAARLRWVNQMPGDLERLSFFFGANRPYGSDIISAVRNGIPEYYKVYDPLVLRTFESLNRAPQGNSILRAIGAFRRFKQEMITTFPAFITANFVKDPLMGTMMTRTGNQHISASITGLARDILRSQEYKDYIANGLGGSSVRDAVRMTRKRVIAHAERENRHFLDPRNMLLGPGDMWRFLRETGRAIEMGPRVGEAHRARVSGLKGPRKGQPATMEEAVFAGSEVSTDFRKRLGGQPTGIEGPIRKITGGRFGFSAGPEWMKFLADNVPFWNAMMASQDRGYRSVARDPHGKTGTAIKIGMVGVGSMLYYAYNRDIAIKYAHLKDEDGRPQVDFLNLPPWAQRVAWHHWIPDQWDPDTLEPVHFNHFTTPKIWEVGMVANWGERFAQSMMDGSEEDQDLFFDLIQITAQNFNINLTPGAIPFPLPAGIDIITEQISNRILFTGQPIETRGMGELEPWARGRSRTPRTLQEFSKLMWKQDWIPDVVKSPARAEALLRGVFGNWATLGLQITDQVFYPGGPALGWDDVLVFNRFYQEPGKYDDNTRIWYENLKKFNQAYGTAREMNKRRDFEMLEKMELDPDQKAMIMMASGHDSANRRLQLINREIDMVRRGVAEPFATPKELHHILNRLEAQRNAIMKSLNEQGKSERKRMKERAGRAQ